MIPDVLAERSRDTLIPAHAYRSVCCWCSHLKCAFVFCNRNEGWSENNIPWWRGPRARSGARGYYYCLGSERPLSIYKVKMLEILLCYLQWCFSTCFLGYHSSGTTGVSGDKITWLSVSCELVWVARGVLRWGNSASQATCVLTTWDNLLWALAAEGDRRQTTTVTVKSLQIFNFKDSLKYWGF